VARWHYAGTWTGQVVAAIDRTGETARDIKGDTEDIKASLAKFDERFRQIEAKQPIAAAGGPAAAQALADLRALPRPDIPNIDAVSDEKLPSEVKRILTAARKPNRAAEGFDGAVAQALREAQARIKMLALVDARKGLADAVAMARAEGQNVAHGTAALLAESGRAARLQLSYREAADFYTQAARAVAFDPSAAVGYALAAADVLYDQGNEFGDNPALVEAIDRYKAALRQTPRDRVPLDWAMTQNNLGNALETLGERESGTARLEEAVAAYSLALEETTRDRVPLDWAMTQNNLGNALETLGERESGTARLEEAVATYCLALEELTRDRAPLGWAFARHGLGNALATLAERTGDRARMAEAIVCLRDAALVYREGGNSHWLPVAERRITKLEAALAGMK
jgi:tetratricopeptide (TPR) repeat protein